MEPILWSEVEEENPRILDELQKENSSVVLNRGFSASVAAISFQGSAKALKIASIAETERVIDEFRREIRVFEACKHPNIVNYYGQGKFRQYTFIMLELCHCDAYELLVLRNKKDVSFKTPSPMWIESCLHIAKGMEYLHSQAFYHRDFHLANWLVIQDPFIVKLSDFGGAQHRDEAPISFSGHMRLSAPEVSIFRKQKLPIPYSYPADVYMFGVALFEIFQGTTGKKRLWVENTNEEVMDRIIAGERPNISTAITDYNRDFVTLFQECWSQNPENRPNFTDISLRLQEILDRSKSQMEAKDRDEMSILLQKLNQHKKKKIPHNTPKVSKNESPAIKETLEHTRNLYVFDEVMSCLQKAIRRSLESDAHYWLKEMFQSGMGGRGMDRLTVIVSEDVSMSSLPIPIYCFDLYSQWKQSFNNPNDKLKVMLELGSMLCRLPKCQTVNHACGYSMLLVQDYIEKEKEKYEGTWVGNPRASWFEKLQQLILDSRGSNMEAEKEAIFLLQRIYTETDQHGNPALESQLWDLFISLKTESPITHQCIVALQALNKKNVGGVSGGRLRIFHAMLLVIRESILLTHPDIPKTLDDLPRIDIDIQSHLELQGRHPTGIYAFSVDRHTTRGKGGKADETYQYGLSTIENLDSAAKFRAMDISHWSPEERAKSHGPAGKFFLNKEKGAPSLISQFFDEGAWCDRSTYPLLPKTDVDPFTKFSRDFYLQWEIRYGSKEAKSTFIIGRQKEELKKLCSEHEVKSEIKLDSKPLKKENSPKKKWKITCSRSMELIALKRTQ